eukprot:366564-Chlamydomonas_euryale.AAC.6
MRYSPGISTAASCRSYLSYIRPLRFFIESAASSAAAVAFTQVVLAHEPPMSRRWPALASCNSVR